jgi:hypothetical protein
MPQELTITGGTATRTIPLAELTALQEAGVTIAPVPLSDQSIDEANQTAIVTFPVTGGNGNVSKLSGTVELSGSLVITDTNGRQVTLSNLKLDLKGGTLDATPTGSRSSLPLVVAHGITTKVSSTSQSYDAREMTITAAAAAFVNKALNTTAFAGGQANGSLTATWNFSS